MVDFEGRPVAGARVSLRVSGLPQAVGETTSGSDGIATFGWRPPGEYLVDVDHEHLGSVLGRPLNVCDTGDDLGWHPSEVPSIELRADASVLLRFHDGRHALPGLPVWLRAFPDGPWLTTLRHTDSEGWLRVAGLAPGPVQVEVAEAHWWPAPIRVEALTAEQARVTAPAAVRVVRRGRLEFLVRGSAEQRRSVRIDLRAKGLGDLETWIRRRLVTTSTIDGRPDGEGRLILDGVPATRVAWTASGPGGTHHGSVRVPSCSSIWLTVDMSIEGEQGCGGTSPLPAATTIG